VYFGGLQAHVVIC